MRNETGLSEAGRQYAAAHAAHYTSKDLREALGIYERIMVAHPNAPEAGFSRSQIESIVKAVVPEKELLDAQVELALTRFEGREQPDMSSSSVHHAS